MSALPEGVELDVNFYLVDDDGLTAKLSVKGLPLMPAALDSPDVGLLLKALGVSQPGNWRPMTREEICEFKRDEEDDE